MQMPLSGSHPSGCTLNCTECPKRQPWKNALSQRKTAHRRRPPAANPSARLSLLPGLAHLRGLRSGGLRRHPAAADAGMAHDTGLRGLHRQLRLCGCHLRRHRGRLHGRHLGPQTDHCHFGRHLFPWFLRLRAGPRTALVCLLSCGCRHRHGHDPAKRSGHGQRVLPRQIPAGSRGQRHHRNATGRNPLGPGSHRARGALWMDLGLLLRFSAHLAGSGSHPLPARGAVDAGSEAEME